MSFWPPITTSTEQSMRGATRASPRRRTGAPLHSAHDGGGEGRVERKAWARDGGAGAIAGGMHVCAGHVVDTATHSPVHSGRFPFTDRVSDHGTGGDRHFGYEREGPPEGGTDDRDLLERKHPRNRGNRSDGHRPMPRRGIHPGARARAPEGSLVRERPLRLARRTWSHGKRGTRLTRRNHGVRGHRSPGFGMGAPGDRGAAWHSPGLTPGHPPSSISRGSTAP